MRSLNSAFFGFAVLFAASAARPSTLSVSVEHQVAVARNQSGAKPTLLRVAFADDPIIINVALDVYAVPQLPSTSKHLAELQRLSPRAWWEQLEWDVRRSGGVRLRVKPRLLTTSVRQRGPSAVNPADRDTSVDCTSYKGSFEVARLAPGDYTLSASVAGLESPRFPLAVRSGQELEVRDVYLQEKARNTRDWTEFKALQLERLRLDPTKAAALIELAQRSLELGTLEETQQYLERAATTMEQNIRDWAKVNPADAKNQAPAVENQVRQMQALQRALPEYFANRARWRISMDSTTGRYTIVARDSSRVVREIE